MKIRVGILTAPKIQYERRGKTFLLKDVRIGIGFHWDRKEDQEFEGELEIQRNADGTETAINTLDIEQYLTSVISSEMATTAPLELLKAHAVISRSWALRAIGHTDHVGFDVCADDHCQRYEGLYRRNERAIRAVEETRGQILEFREPGTENRQICDCRYHKCCGGRTENFATCWEDIDVPYLRSVECPYCGEAVHHTSLLRTSLNDYDQETHDYHDWTVRHTTAELSDIVRRKSGKDFGEIHDLIPLARGASGRIYRLRVVGSHLTEEVGKELSIRKLLSESCLYSSWMDIEKTPEGFTFRGHGWGHGVGLCQIGAAVMAEKGFTYDQILSHYYSCSAIGRID